MIFLKLMKMLMNNFEGWKCFCLILQPTLMDGVCGGYANPMDMEDKVLSTYLPLPPQTQSHFPITSSSKTNMKFN